MKKILQLGSAFIGVIVGAGFASGQEILQYFTSFGLAGTMGAIVCTILFGYLGMILIRLGSRMQTTSHKEVIYRISGRYLGLIIDYVIIFTLFGVGVVMIAGAGSNLNQQFDFPYFIGTSLMFILVLLTGMLKVDRVVAIVGGITPFLILIVVILSIYSLVTMDGSFASLDTIAKEHPTSLPNWIISAINYVSFNIALGASMALVMGGAEDNEKTAALGGLVGGLGIGVLILLSHLAIFSNIDALQGEMPMLQLANIVSPTLGFVMSIVLFSMIFNTAVSMFFSFSSRFTEMGTRKFKLFLVISLVIAYALSFFGFTDLVSYFYPLIGYLGLVLIITLIVASFRIEKVKRSTSDQQ
ncbi:membrane protein [Oceanobacillus massiliensis]|uniref:YkvI family membrane protein n=1 Tax=Oceanobacillus massiliensis TaxID=1465765 RepID=UPI00028A3A56|nr:membrane protein [Oceanobacillus massiliensis]